MKIEYKDFSLLKNDVDEDTGERRITQKNLAEIAYSNRSMATSIGLWEICDTKLVCRLHDHGISIHKSSDEFREYYLLIAKMTTYENWSPLYKGESGNGVYHQIVDYNAEGYVRFVCDDHNLIANEEIDPRLLRLLITEQVFRHFS